MRARSVVILLMVTLVALVAELALALSRAPEGGLPVFRPGYVVAAVVLTTVALAAFDWFGRRG
jgi:hypothetical protein